mmetsp:Transcript_10971/g.22873  ORF Transcript_10971/g.22873 Transcript_10971/m.22873 type:complete len:378 (-) Transcript_10971:2154-3287(-)
MRGLILARLALLAVLGLLLRTHVAVKHANRQRCQRAVLRVHLEVDDKVPDGVCGVVLRGAAVVAAAVVLRPGVDEHHVGVAGVIVPIRRREVGCSRHLHSKHSDHLPLVWCLLHHDPLDSGIFHVQDGHMDLLRVHHQRAHDLRYQQAPEGPEAWDGGDVEGGEERGQLEGEAAVEDGVGHEGHRHAAHDGHDGEQRLQPNAHVADELHLRHHHLHIEEGVEVAFDAPPPHLVPGHLHHHLDDDVIALPAVHAHALRLRRQLSEVEQQHQRVHLLEHWGGQQDVVQLLGVEVVNEFRHCAVDAWPHGNQQLVNVLHGGEVGGKGPCGEPSPYAKSVGEVLGHVAAILQAEPAQGTQVLQKIVTEATWLDLFNLQLLG